MEPALFPQWHKAAKSSAAGGAGNAGSSARSGSGVFARNGLSVGDRSLTREKDLNPNPYSNFGVGRRRERKRELETRGKDRASVVDNNGFEASSKVSRLRRPDSTVVGRSVDPPKRVGSGTRNGVVTRGNLVGGSGKASFERDFPLLKEKQQDTDRASSHVLSSLPKGTFSGHAVQTLNVTTGARNMAEALVRAPRVRTPPEIDANKQRMEEMALSKVKRLIPVTPSMPKSSVLNSSDKSRLNGARGDLSGPSKVGQHSSSQLVNHTLRAPLRTDIPKLPQPGNFQILKRERDGVSSTAKDAPIVSRVISPTKDVSSSACPPLKDPLSSKLQSVCKVTTLTSAHNSFKDKAPLIRAQKRNDFFNALRKKTSTNNLCAGCNPSSDDSTGLEKSGEHSSGSFSSSLESGKLAEQIFGSISMGSEKSGVESSGSSSSNLENNHSASSSGFNFSIENVNGVTGDFNVYENSESLSDYGENRHEVPAIDAEKEKALLKDLGWEEDAREEALTPEEIGTFLKKYEKQTPSLKLPHCKFHGLMADLLRRGVTDRAGSSSSVCTAEARVC